MSGINTRNEPRLGAEVWRARVDGAWWTARLIAVDDVTCLCSFSVLPSSATREERSGAAPNCHWDYNVDHFLGRWNKKTQLPQEVLVQLRDALRDLDWPAPRAEASHTRLSRCDLALRAVAG